jgi:hypothetical protein
VVKINRPVGTNCKIRTGRFLVEPKTRRNFASPPLASVSGEILSDRAKSYDRSAQDHNRKRDFRHLAKTLPA